MKEDKANLTPEHLNFMLEETHKSIDQAAKLTIEAQGVGSYTRLTALIAYRNYLGEELVIAELREWVR